MLERIVSYFTSRHLLANTIVVAVFVGGLLSWQYIKKEEMPDVTFDRVRVSAVYPGATAGEVEHFVTKELEDAVKGLDGVYRVTSSSSQGKSSLEVEIEQYYPDLDEAITEIRNAVSGVDLPDDVEDDPVVRVFKTSRKAIIDVAVFDTSVHLLDTPHRQKLQEYALALENRLLNLGEVNSVDKSGYLQEEIRIDVNPERLKHYNIPLSQVKSAISQNHSRQPAGSIEAKNEPKVTINAQLDTVDKLSALFIQAGFEGKAVTLGELAEVSVAFDRGKDILKVNGHEAVIVRVVKNSSAGILEAVDAVKAAVADFRDASLGSGVSMDIAVLDDESMDVRNRLSLIATNGVIGFVFILVALFFFLDKKSGLWVGMGIPLTICFTLLGATLIGYTINNTTLAAVIIVMGIVVDDAIVIAENITRSRRSGLDPEAASVRGTSQVFLPVLASVLTTCIAFVPLYFFSGRFGHMNRFIPPIIFLMLIASLLESLFILPGHLCLRLPTLPFARRRAAVTLKSGHWFDRVEAFYGRVLERVLPFKYVVFLLFVGLLLAAGWVIREKMKFVMFPNEETREIVISAEAPPDADRYDTAELTRKIESVFVPYIGREVVGFRTGIAQSRRGGEVQENRFRMIIEIVDKEKREKSADELVAIWRPEFDKIEGVGKLVVQKSRWGQSSGSAIEIIVQENDDGMRRTAADRIAGLLRDAGMFANVDIERPLMVPEYRIDFMRDKIKRLDITPSDISSAFRTALEGTILYELPKGDEEMDVRLTVRPQDKTDIEKILDIPVENNRDYLVPVRDVITIEKTSTPNSISRRNSKRVTTVYADIRPDAGITPLDAADYIEDKIFPVITHSQPSTALDFIGEIADTRESKADFRNVVIIVLLLIFAVLEILFNSFTKPLIIMLSIPFGLVGVIFAFWLHGQLLFGFFAGIGCLGLAGVVINDSIVMLSKLDSDFAADSSARINAAVAAVAQTRLKAVVLTTVTTVAGVLPTAYGLAGYDAMLAQMMLALAWGLAFGTLITLLLIPCLYALLQEWKFFFKSLFQQRSVTDA